MVEGTALNPVWSPDGSLIVYAGRSIVGQVQLLGARPDGAAVDLPPMMVRPGGYRFLPSGKGLVYLPGIHSRDFWLLDFDSKQQRQLTSPRESGRTADVRHHGRREVDRLRPLAAELECRVDRVAERVTAAGISDQGSGTGRARGERPSRRSLSLGGQIFFATLIALAMDAPKTARRLRRLQSI